MKRRITFSHFEDADTGKRVQREHDVDGETVRFALHEADKLKAIAGVKRLKPRYARAGA